MSLFNELKRRNVFKVSIAYIVMAWLVLQVADVILNNIVAPGWIFHVLLLFLSIGLPIAVFFAWAFELTPEGLKREHEVDRTESIAPQTGKKLNLIIFTILIAALGYFAFDKFVLDASRDAALVKSATESARNLKQTFIPAESDKSIAVLPFVDMSPEKDQEYMSDGIAEELLNMLVKIPELRVISRSSAFAFKGSNVALPEIARQLNVAYALVGSIRKSGDQIRITAQLVDAETDTHLWSESYDRSLDNIFVIQDEISSEVIKALQIELLGKAPTAASTDTEAYTLYLKGRHFEKLDTKEAWEMSESAFRQALAIDPNYAPAWAGLSLTLNSQVNLGVINQTEGTEKSRSAAIRALEIDDSLADAWAALASIQFSYDWDWNTSAGTIRTALQYGPRDADVLEVAAYIYRGLGQIDEAVKFAQLAAELDPLSLSSLRTLGITYWAAGQHHEAQKVYQQVLELYPDQLTIQAFLAIQLMLQEKPEEGLQFIDASSDNIWQRFASAMLFIYLGRTEASGLALQRFIEQEHDIMAYQIAEIHAMQGFPDKAFEWLERAYQQRDSGLTQLIFDPYLASLHPDPRWEPFLLQMGLLKYWQAKHQTEPGT